MAGKNRRKGKTRKAQQSAAPNRHKEAIKENVLPATNLLQPQSAKSYVDNPDIKQGQGDTCDQDDLVPVTLPQRTVLHHLESTPLASSSAVNMSGLGGSRAEAPSRLADCQDSIEAEGPRVFVETDTCKSLEINAPAESCSTLNKSFEESGDMSEVSEDQLAYSPKSMTSGYEATSCSYVSAEEDIGDDEITHVHSHSSAEEDTEVDKDGTYSYQRSPSTAALTPTAADSFYTDPDSIIDPQLSSTAARVDYGGEHSSSGNIMDKSSEQSTPNTTSGELSCEQFQQQAVDAVNEIDKAIDADQAGSSSSPARSASALADDGADGDVQSSASLYSDTSVGPAVDEQQVMAETLLPALIESIPEPQDTDSQEVSPTVDHSDSTTLADNSGDPEHSATELSGIVKSPVLPETPTSADDSVTSASPEHAPAAVVLTVKTMPADAARLSTEGTDTDDTKVSPAPDTSMKVGEGQAESSDAAKLSAQLPAEPLQATSAPEEKSALGESTTPSAHQPADPPAEKAASLSQVSGIAETEPIKDLTTQQHVETTQAAMKTDDISPVPVAVVAGAVADPKPAAEPQPAAITTKEAELTASQKKKKAGAVSAGPTAEPGCCCIL